MPRGCSRPVLILATLLSLPAGLLAQTPGVPPSPPMTLAQSVVFATEHNPTLLAARQHLQGVRANEITAKIRQDPSLTVSGADVTLGADNPASPYAYSANLSRLFERGQKRRWRMESTRAYSDVAEQQYKDQERQILFQVRQNFIQMLQSAEVLDLAKQDLESWNHTLQLSKVRLDVGDISGTDFARLDLQLAQFESDYDNAVQDLRQNSDQLQVLLGIEHPTPSFSITGNLTPPAFNKSLAEIEQTALATRPDLLAAQHMVDAATADHRLAIANGTADPTLAAEYERVATYNSLGFSVSIPLRFFDRNQGEKARTALEADSSRFALIAARNQVVSDVDQAWAGYLTAVHLATRYNEHYLDEAQHVRDNLEFSYQHGNATLLDFLDTLRDYRQTRLNGVNADAQVWLAIAQLSTTADTEMVP